MSDKTHIAWADSTWNPWRGCTKVSPGCLNCYAEKLVTGRLGGKWGKGAPRVRAAVATFNAPLKWNKKPLICEECGAVWSGLYSASRDAVCQDCGTMNDFHRRRVFLGSLMDWLDPEVPVEWLADTLQIVRECPGLDFLTLTKRPEHFIARLQAVRAREQYTKLGLWADEWIRGTPAKNIWIGASVEDQKRADERIPELLKIPAQVRFLSVEPLLEHINIEQYLLSDYDKAAMDDQLITPIKGFNHVKIDWVIAGLESGPARRDPGIGPIADSWDAPEAGLVVQCKEYSTPLFVKQDAAAKPGQKGRISDAIFDLKQFPKQRDEPAHPNPDR
jgi:protein gp37